MQETKMELGEKRGRMLVREEGSKAGGRMGRRKMSSRPRSQKRALREIYDKTNGYCNLCGKKLSFVNYGAPRGRAPWEIDHSNPVSKGGTDYKRNLKATCPSCNRGKGSTRRPAYREKSWLDRLLGL